LEPKFTGIIKLVAQKTENPQPDKNKNKPTPQEINKVNDNLKKAVKNGKKTDLENAIVEAKELKDRGASSSELEDQEKSARDKLAELEKSQTGSHSSFFRKEVIIPIALISIFVLFLLIVYQKRKK